MEDVCNSDGHISLERQVKWLSLKKNNLTKKRYDNMFSKRCNTKAYQVFNLLTQQPTGITEVHNPIQKIWQMNTVWSLKMFPLDLEVYI